MLGPARCRLCARPVAQLPNGISAKLPIVVHGRQTLALGRMGGKANAIVGQMRASCLALVLVLLCAGVGVVAVGCLAD